MNDSRRNESLVFRLALLVWLVKNGHTTWMWRSGAWLCILTNEKRGKFCVRERRGPNGEYLLWPSRKEEIACDYVYGNIQSERLWENFDLETLW